jgi:hypothetical protein
VATGEDEKGTKRRRKGKVKGAYEEMEEKDEQEKTMKRKEKENMEKK